MNHFFCESDLTEEQKSKWQELLSQYKAILRGNTIMKARAMSDAERALCASIMGITVDSASEFEEKFVSHSVDLTDFAGSPRSALFARLLSGRVPLPSPPPTIFGFPWYEIVEETGPFPVKANPSAGDLVINQCRWSVVERNEAALRLLTLHEKASEWVRSEWISLPREKDFSQILQIYNEGPEFIVTYPGIGRYRLFVSGFKPIISTDSSALQSVESVRFRSIFTFLTDVYSMNGCLDGDKAGWYLQKSSV